MKHLLLTLIIGISTLTAAPVILPTPTKIEVKKEAAFTLTRDTKIFYSKKASQSLAPIANVLAHELELVTGILPKAEPAESRESLRPGDILLHIAAPEDIASDEASQDQSYTIDANKRGISIRGKNPKSISYGTATLIQALQENSRANWEIPAMKIEDSPAVEFRTAMIDIARSVHSLGVVRDVIRLCRQYKVRYVHLHLTDDQNFTFPFEPITGAIDGNFAYSKQDLIDLVAYADARGVTLIPELDLPGHSTKVRASGYLDPTEGDRDVADPKNYAKINAIIDEMIEVFASSPYFHIGGDESSAGSALVPFLESVNKHVRSRGKRLLVWEGFHGAPTRELPAKGDDRIIVVAWESTYNAPWNLLENGYEIVNASWKPMYVVGGFGGLVHPGSTGGRKFNIEDIYRWNKSRFMHWESGRPIFEDKGPNDTNKDDGEWDAEWIGKSDQIIGGQLLFWEQQEESVIKFFRTRVPTMSERLWNPTTGHDFATFEKRLAIADERIMTIVQPIEILPSKIRSTEPVDDLYHPYTGDTLTVTMRNRTKIPGSIHFTRGSMSNNLGGLRFSKAEAHSANSKKYTAPFEEKGGFSYRAALYREDGTPIDGDTWQFFNNWPPLVKVTEYEIGRKTLPEVQDLAALPKEKIMRTFNMPMVRGPIRNVDIHGQLTESILTAPGTGVFTFGLKTQSGHATLRIDSEVIIKDTPRNETWQTGEITLKKGQEYRLRIDHHTGMPRPVLGLSIEGPGTEGKSDAEPFLTLPKK